MHYLKSKGRRSNPLHFGLRVQQLVQGSTTVVVVRHLIKIVSKLRTATTTETVFVFFSELVNGKWKSGTISKRTIYVKEIIAKIRETKIRQNGGFPSSQSYYQ